MAFLSRCTTADGDECRKPWDKDRRERNGAGWASSTRVDAARATHAIDYTPTEPLLVVAVDADVCFEHERWRHTTTFRRVRDDLRPTDLL